MVEEVESITFAEVRLQKDKEFLKKSKLLETKKHRIWSWNKNEIH